MGWPSQSRPRARLAICGALGRASVKSGAANQRSPNMSTASIAKSRNLKTAAPKKRSVQSSAIARRKVTSAATTAKAPPNSDERKVERVTKQELLLTLLSQAQGASIGEMMQATEWQQQRRGTDPARLNHGAGGHTRSEIEAETRRSPVGANGCSGPPTRTPGDGTLPWGYLCRSYHGVPTTPS